MTSFIPKGLKVASGIDYIKLCWDSVEDSTNYHVYKRNRYLSLEIESEESRVVPSSSNCLKWEDIDDKQDYYFIVKAYNDKIGESRESEIIIKSPMTRISVDKSGMESNNDSFFPEISGNGRYIVYSSDSTNLVDNDKNEKRDIFIYDLITGNTTRITDGNDNSDKPAITYDGVYVVFQSDANNLVTKDENGFRDIFLYDTEIDLLKIIVHGFDKISHGNGNSQNPDITGNGDYILFESDATNLVEGGVDKLNIFEYTKETEVITSIVTNGNDAGVFSEYASNNSLDAQASANNGIKDIILINFATGTKLYYITQGDKDSINPKVSGDGKYVVFESDATNLVDGDTNDMTDIFLYNIETRITNRVNVDCHGMIQADGNSYNPSISTDGKYLTFESNATNLVPEDNNGSSDIFVVPNTACM